LNNGQQIRAINRAT